mmetsp:Transcript_30739/g.86694  ORF Transcript_30739/g.86694 Transcript_30739/m.86694 type:complete len:218 (+) Transcript_30739:1473-2126(+)
MEPGAEGRLRRFRGVQQRERDLREPLQLLHEPQGREHDHRHGLLGFAGVLPHGQTVPDVQALRQGGRRDRLRRQPEPHPADVCRLLRRRHALPHRPLLHVQRLGRRLRARRVHGRLRPQGEAVRGLAGGPRDPRGQPRKPGRPQRLDDGAEWAVAGAMQHGRAEGGRPEAVGGRRDGEPRHRHLPRRPHRDRGVPEGHGVPGRARRHHRVEDERRAL